MKKGLFCLFTFSLFFCLTACQPMSVEFHPSSMMNPDTNYKTNPVTVNLYQLRDGNKFYKASYYDLTKRPKVVLGDDLISLRSVELIPGENKVLNIMRLSGAKYLGAVALFIKPSANQQWRVIKSIINIPPVFPTRITFGLTENKIYVY